MTRSPSPTPTLLAALPNGSIVRCPDGSIGEQAWGSYAESHVIHRDQVLGRGPHIFQRWQVEAATPGQASDYSQRCVDLLVEQSKAVAL